VQLHRHTSFFQLNVVREGLLHSVNIIIFILEEEGGGRLGGDVGLNVGDEPKKLVSSTAKWPG